jgi:hypothetical protein
MWRVWEDRVSSGPETQRDASLRAPVRRRLAFVEWLARWSVPPFRVETRRAIDRANDLVDDERDRFIDALTRFVRTYGFLSQIVTFGDTDLRTRRLLLTSARRHDPGAVGLEAIGRGLKPVR